MLELANMTQDFMKNIRNNKKEYAQHCYYSENNKIGTEYNEKKKKKKTKREKLQGMHKIVKNIFLRMKERRRENLSKIATKILPKMRKKKTKRIWQKLVQKAVKNIFYVLISITTNDIM